MDIILSQYLDLSCIIVMDLEGNDGRERGEYLFDLINATRIKYVIISSFGGKIPSIKPSISVMYALPKKYIKDYNFTDFEETCYDFEVGIEILWTLDVKAVGITIQDNPRCHLKFDNCVGVNNYARK
uniref:Uncharacterized protein n=1 Tax=Tanacetum cinerariifolium TaxID=118510 RepID=A0A6L2NT55_TANCI|nr:hypothetical protein [Tanacetum cinerariifolium]